MKKTILFGIGGMLLLALLAGAAFMGMRLINARASSQGLPGAGGGGMLQLSGKGGPGGGKMSIQIQITPAAELPRSSPDFVGQVSSIQGNSIYVVQMNQFSGGPSTSSSGGQSDSGGGSTTSDGVPTQSANGPTIEVVVTKETVIYRDQTMEDVPKPSGSGSQSIGMQQKVELADISQVVQDYMVQVWGQKRGDRLIADVIVVMGPAVIMFKNPGQ